MSMLIRWDQIQLLVCCDSVLASIDCCYPSRERFQRFDLVYAVCYHGKVSEVVKWQLGQLRLEVCPESYRSYYDANSYTHERKRAE